ncbi:hypothetical protein [Kluyvera georgiana]|uniref:hypothetical protein n=1 Tax=Kluyvera georgiana TaxID=73098 RepID=UPI0023021B3A|nr:hypothetical protein [Kluyvera georgiana]MDA8492457.1 hypothetical protein [Kluyvera georgiana]
MNSRPDDRNQVTPEQPGNQFPIGAETKHDQHQWIVRSVNELKDDNSKLNTRIDQVYSHLSDTNNTATLACAISRIETTMGGVERQLSKLDGIDSKLGEHTAFLQSANRQLDKLEGINSKLGEHSILLSGLPEISKKLERLENIETTVSRVKWFFAGLGALLTACAGISWWLFGTYLTKILEALNSLVLK